VRDGRAAIAAGPVGWVELLRNSSPTIAARKTTEGLSCAQPFLRNSLISGNILLENFQAKNTNEIM
jgi:hypothetical protein